MHWRGDQETKWRRQFDELGREAVRRNFEAGVYWRTRHGEVAKRWLRDQERGAENWAKWEVALAIFGAIGLVAGILVALK